MSIQLQPSVSLVTLVKTESLTVIKIEPPEEALEKEISPDIKDIDIVYHSLSEDLIKSETVPENILETKYSESVETQVLVKTEDTSDENVTRGTAQEVIEVQGSNEYSNVLGNLESDKQLVSYLSTYSNAFSTKNRKAKQPEKTNFAKCYKTVETTSWKKDKEKIKVIEASVIPVEEHEYNSLAQDKYICNHCQHAYNALSGIRQHIKLMHRKLTTIYQCPYCPYYYKFKYSIKKHIILKHKDTKDIQWFQCNLCEMKFKLKYRLTEHMKVHLRRTQIKYGLDLREKRYHCNNCDYKSHEHYKLKRHNLVHLKPEKIEYFYCYHCSFKCKRKFYRKIHIFRQHLKNIKQGKSYHCDNCDYETYSHTDLKKHNVVHLKPEEIEYFYCYQCSHKNKRKQDLKRHILRQHFKNVKQGKSYHCDNCHYKADCHINLKRHKLIHLKPEEIEYFYCYLCSHKNKFKQKLKTHIFRYHFKNVKQGKRYSCNKCNYRTDESSHLKDHKLTHLKPEEIQYFYCYHCSYKAKRKGDLKKHIFRHFEKEQVKFDFYICNFVTSKKESIIKHIKKHSKVQKKSKNNEGS